MATMFKKCNLCNLNAIKERAMLSRKAVTLDTDNSVYVHPGNVDLGKLGTVERGQYWVARFTAIPSECLCHLRKAGGR